MLTPPHTRIRVCAFLTRHELTSTLVSRVSCPAPAYTHTAANGAAVHSTGGAGPCVTKFKTNSCAFTDLPKTTYSWVRATSFRISDSRHRHAHSWDILTFSVISFENSNVKSSTLTPVSAFPSSQVSLMSHQFRGRWPPPGHRCFCAPCLFLATGIRCRGPNRQLSLFTVTCLQCADIAPQRTPPAH